MRPSNRRGGWLRRSTSRGVSAALSVGPCWRQPPGRRHSSASSVRSWPGSDRDASSPRPDVSAWRLAAASAAAASV
jgi:hypothetical protein